MGWVKALSSDREKLIRLLKHNEWDHLHFSSAVNEKARLRLFGKGIFYILKSSQSQIKAALFISKGGALHGCFEPNDLTKQDLSQMRKILQNRSFFSLIGRSDRVRLMEDFMGYEESHEVDYQLYELSPHRKPLELEDKGDANILYRRADISDFKKLYPLEKAYQIEEVMRNPDQLNESYLKRKFYNQLDNEIIWIGIVENRIVCKGGTNARGFDYAQLGGVYTVPEFRGKSIASGLIKNLDEELKSMGWGSALFVRNDNQAAIGLYKSCRYIHRGEFRIVYPINERF